MGVNDGMSEWSEIDVDVNQDCVMFNVFMDGALHIM